MDMKQLAESTGLEWDGGDDTRLYVSGIINFYPQPGTKEIYKSFEKDLDTKTWKGNGFEIYGSYDVSGYDYWNNTMDEPNHIMVAAEIDQSKINEIDIDELSDKMNEAYTYFADKYDNYDEYENFKNISDNKEASMKKQASYYSKELERLGSEGFPIHVQFKSDKGDTKWMDINAESIPDIIAFLESQKSSQIENKEATMKPTQEIKDRLEEIRESLNNENISYGELAELESLKEYIDPSDVQLLEAAGVPEFPEDDNKEASINWDRDIVASLKKAELGKNDFFIVTKNNVLVREIANDMGQWNTYNLNIGDTGYIKEIRHGEILDPAIYISVDGYNDNEKFVTSFYGLKKSKKEDISSEFEE